jgi:hypothetical protein
VIVRGVDPWLLQQLAQETFGGLLVTSILKQNVEHEAVLVNRAPEPMLPGLELLPFASAHGSRSSSLLSRASSPDLMILSGRDLL